MSIECIKDANLEETGFSYTMSLIQGKYKMFILYALMGWLIVVALRAIIQALPPLGLALLVGGGLAYTVGILFYKSQRGYMHFVWHLFVLAGSVLQYVCIALYCV